VVTILKPPPPRPLTIGSLTDAALAQKPAPKPAPKPVAAAAPTITAAAPSAGAGWVQIGAYSSAELAEKGWSDTAKLEPGAMAGKGQRVESVSVGGKTLYRAYVTGFTHDGAESFCGQLKAAGKACFVK
jgi:cell division protein FtsN